ncbi:4Fe-4S ferredoxin, iron-sulpur binding domain-containing protein [Desulfovibrio sp. X2]|uniref:4Fe-4S dicluster domain-containing protein n=1 Tax=Desulfovibrio sp. X2 TaxID=941449 RepID=UPI00035884CF|nr:4Fe-4S dicluster domain-containing protein [Desulfovibrio sp. X2]EPR38736.1 4Fe-4S ferredoxin, iron-sulpur binding domain-containing protein [Desulfovibrio sp. X2]
MDVFRLADQAAPIEPVPAPERVRLPLLGAGVCVGVGDAVVRDQRVAVAARPGLGDVHASVAGVVVAIDDAALTIENAGETGREPRGELAGAAPAELCRSLASLGVRCDDLLEADLVVVNALEPEPGVSSFMALARHENQVLQAGAALLQRILEPSRIVLAAPKGAGLTLGHNPVHELSVRYPENLDPLVVRAVTGKERPAEVVSMGVDRLWRMGVASRGRPVTETVLSVGGKNLRVAVGTPVRLVLEAAGLAPEPGDRVLLGGVFRGEALWDLDAPVPKEAYALTVVPRDLAAHYGEHPCINCGECHLVCPARILVGIMARFAEFGFWEKARAYDLDSCIECGLCAYVCPARRPLLQYIRLARHELSLVEEFAPGPQPPEGATLDPSADPSGSPSGNPSGNPSEEARA